MKKAQRILAALIALPLLLTVLTGCELIGALEIKMGLHEHDSSAFTKDGYFCNCFPQDFPITCVMVKYVGEDKEEIVLPKTIGTHTLTTIGRGSPAFSDCSSLKSVTIPETVKYISYGAFSQCGSLVELKVDENNETFHSDGNCIIETATNTLVAGCAGSVIPDYVTAIGSSAFLRCTSLTSITIPDSVTEIEDGAFNGCDLLTELKVDKNNKTFHSDGNCIIETATNTLVVGCASSVIPDYVKAIGRHAFSDRKSLTSMTIPDSVTSIDAAAFSGCTSLTSIAIPNSVTSIEDDAFSNCTSLTSVAIGNGVELISLEAFYGCESLKEINCSGTMEQWKTIYIGYRSSLGVKANVVHCVDGDVDIPEY